MTDHEGLAIHAGKNKNTCAGQWVVENTTAWELWAVEVMETQPVHYCMGALGSGGYGNSTGTLLHGSAGQWGLWKLNRYTTEWHGMARLHEGDRAGNP